MCELFGICAAEKLRANEYLDAFYHHSFEHKHGWGLAVFHGSGVTLEKEPVRAVDSGYLRNRLSREVLASNLLAHIRLATIGRIEYANCHPFVYDDDSGRTWTMIHNGTMFESGDLSKYLPSQEGTTDSERILMFIVDCVNQEYAKSGAPLSAEDRFSLIDRITIRLSRGNKLNMLLYDGEYMYAHTNCPDGLYLQENPGRILVATKPLLEEGWRKFPENQLHVYKSGAPAFAGTIHENTFHEEDYDMTPLLSAYAEL